MKLNLFAFRHSAVVAVGLGVLTSIASHAATVSWTGASGTDTNWSNAANWTGGTPAGNDIKFYIAGAASATNTVNTVVDTSLTINSLQFANTNFIIPPTNAHTLSISAGQALNITGSAGVTVGTLTDAGNTNYIYNSIVGSGALFVSNTAAIILVDQGKSASANATQRATLDMAGLDTFSASVSRISVGTTIDGGANNVQNATGTLLLGRTNTITAAFAGTYTTAGIPLTNSIQVGLNNGNNGGPNFLFLGHVNTINCDSIGVGKAKTTSSMLFNPAFSSPSAVFRGASGGSSRVSFWAIGDMSDSGTSSGSAVGTNDFSGGTVDALVNTISLARDRSTANTGTAPTRGILTFTAGTIDVNTLLVGNQFFSNPTNTNPMFGFVNVNGPTANLTVNTSLVLGNTASATSAAATNTSGTLNINGGNVTAAVITAGAKSITNSINLNTGRLTLSTTAGTAALPIANLGTTNGAFTLTVASARTNIFVKNLSVGGTTNLIDLAGVSGLGSYPTQIVLIKYTGAILGTFNFGLSNVPVGVAGSIVDNSANSSVDLLLTAGPEPPTVRTWTGLQNANWDIATSTNWVNPSAVPSFYFEGDFPLFNDAASGSTAVVLPANVTPGSVTISNVTKSYSFAGPGGISGATSLLKLGSGTVTLLGTNTYTGGTTISNGVLQLGDGTSATGTIAGNVANNGSLIVANPAAQILSGAITGGGTLSKSGSGTLTLTGNSSYTGSTTISAGTLQLGSGSTSGLITTDVTNNATFGINRSDNIVFGNIISGGGSFVKSGGGTTVLSAANTYSGGSTNTAGTLVLSNNAAIGTGNMVYFGGFVHLAPGVTITNNFIVTNSSATDFMMDVSANGAAATWAGDIFVTGAAQFRPAGIAGTLDLTGNGSFGPSFFIIPRGTVEIVSNANFSSSAFCAFGRNSTGNSTFTRLKGNATVTLGGVSLGGGQSTGGRVELLMQDNATLNLGATNFDIHNSTAAAAVTTLNLNGGTLIMGGQIKSQTGGTQLSTNNFNGGTMRAGKDNTSFLPASLGLVANVRNGGAIIDDNGFTIGIALPLLHSVIPGDNATDGGLTKLGTGTLVLNSVNSYNGPTTVTAGTLAGTGLVAGPLVLQTNATLSPANTGIGTFTVTNDVTFQFGSTNLMQLNMDTLANDQLVGVSNLTYGGTLVITNIGAQAITNGTAFKLFTAATYAGAFDAIVPAAPDVGLAWSNRLAIDGTLLVVSTATPVSTNANLASLVVTPAGTLVPAFASNVLSYTATNAYANSPITVTPTAADPAATIQVIFGGVTNVVVSGNPSPALTLDTVPLAANPVEVRVTAADATTVLSYNVAVTRLPSTAPVTVTRTVSGGNLIMSWPVDHQGWTLQMQTNSRAIGLQTNWVNLPGSTSSSSYTNPISITDPTTFFRLNYLAP
ncbi:MAG: hypothetical protein RLY20_2744 [Verrucomicrobiota bacterium]|jgi:autotransporter-associated beta strand protein